MSYGERSEEGDGRAFIKYDSDGRRLSNKFKQTAAYDALFMELAMDADKFAKFVTAILPKDLQGQDFEDLKAQAMKKLQVTEE